MTNEKITIKHGINDLFPGVIITASLDNGKKIQLEYTKETETSGTDRHGTYKRKHLTFENTVEKVRLELQVTDYVDMITATVHSSVEQEEVFFKPISFSPQNGIEITIESIKDLDYLLCYYHFNDWWTRPKFLTDFSEVPERTQSMLWLKNNQYYCFLPLVSESCKTELVGTEGGVVLQLSSYIGGTSNINTPIFVLKKGDNPFILMRDTISVILQDLHLPQPLREHKHYPEILEYLGWCSWDAFYHDVNEPGIVEKMEELKDKGIPVKWVMIDDGWQEVKEKQLQSFQADKQKFPNGINNLIELMKSKYKVNWVGVWHTLFGYWGGIDPESKLATDYKEFLFQTNNKKLLPAPDASKGFAFWNSFHNHLKQEGIDFVKVDCQGAINNFYSNHLSPGRAAKEVHLALEASTSANFGNTVINCMGMAAENIWYRHTSAVSRNSDDFVPGKEISFKEHALQNVYNSLYHSQLYWGDWDMFWTNHEEAKQNAVLRALSGGPIYFSDRVGDTAPEMINPLILKSGKILRAEQPGLPTEDMLFVDPTNSGTALKVWNKVGNGAVLGVFNIDELDRKVNGKVSPSLIPFLDQGSFIVYEYFSGIVKHMNYEDSLDIQLDKEEVRLYIILPAEKFVPIGLLNKFLSPLTVKTVVVQSNRAIMEVTEGGRFGFICQEAISNIAINGIPTAKYRRNDNYYDIILPETNSMITVEIEWRNN
ncbi:Sip1-related alpha-galactosidase [Bacillus kwashiorkori]|uniref:Sip1-related alpha-galactosidase n=1 Tax=Bacillus kwashiorkori TaxID=1522318 RepID=UPI00078667CA|nr:Sip1-related alpha-galactosidase [Bacillus kwashiorkori]